MLSHFARALSYSLLICATLFAQTTFAVEIPPYIQHQHVESLRGFLSKHPYYSLASDTVCYCEEQLNTYRQENPEFMPYYAVGDMNDDSISDFAVGLLDSRQSENENPTLTLVIFHGPFKKHHATKGIMVFNNFQINRPKEVLHVFKSRVEQGRRLPARLDIGPGPFGSDDIHLVIYNKKLKKYRVSYFWDMQ